MSNIKNKVENFKFKRSANNEKEINNLANLTKGSLYKLLSILVVPRHRKKRKTIVLHF
jgi:hypothetical protein